MRSPFLLAVAILCTGTINAAEDAQLAIRDTGDHFPMGLPSFRDVKKCYLEAPDGKIIEFIPHDESSDKIQKLPAEEYIQCRAQINDLEESDTGLWKLHAEFSSSSDSHTYNLTVNPAQDEDKKLVQNLTPQTIKTRIGAEHEVVIPGADPTFQTIEACEVLTPSGMQFSTTSLRMEGVELYTSDTVACGIKIEVQSGDTVGEWVLISNVRTLGDRIERRLPFTIFVEEIVDAYVKEIHIAEGKDMYVRLRNAIEEYETCTLMGSNGKEFESYELDPRYTNTCGFIVKNVNTNVHGNWEIVYGNSIVYRAPFVVSILGALAADSSSNHVFILGRPVSVNVGPENVVYCKVQDPRGFLVSEGFGRCNVTLDRVDMDHSGVWKMAYGLHGQVLTEDKEFNVEVTQAATKAIVITNVVSNKPIVTLTCTVSSPEPVRTCKFRDPSGQVLIAAEGVGESRYSFHGSEVSYTSGVHTHDCGLQITDPVVADLGLWRCGVETEGDTHYGFLTVLCPWALRDPEVAAEVVMEPTLTPDRDSVTAVVGDTVSMSCSVQSAIRYCYFRARNGTVFSVEPGKSHDGATYLGAGLDAGECGIRFPTLAVSDTGAWSCHVGLVAADEEEQRATINVTVHEAFAVEQLMVGVHLHIEGRVYGNRQLDYCRFVRIDGLGFIGDSQSVPEGYHSQDTLSTGRCHLIVDHPTMLDHHPWTVVARVRGEEEVSRSTAHTIDMPVGDVNPDNEHPPVIVFFRVPYTWIVLMSAGVILILIASLIGPKKNRDWTCERARAVRNSFRSSILKKPLTDDNNTAMAA